MKLDEYAIDDLHQIACAEWSDAGMLYRLANRLYRVHVLALVLLIRLGRRWCR